MFLWLKAPDPNTGREANVYFDARIIGAPAALANFSVQGWLLGMQKSGSVLAQQLFLNLSNIVFCIFFALPLGGWGLGLDVRGVGLATTVANYATLLVGLMSYLELWLCICHLSGVRSGSKSFRRKPAAAKKNSSPGRVEGRQPPPLPTADIGSY